jgi:hypothetical protein
MTNQVDNRTPEQRKAYVQNKTSYLPKAVYADLMLMKRIMLKLADKNKIDIENMDDQVPGV